MKAVKVYSTYIKYFPRLLELAKNCQTSELTQLLLTVFKNTLLREKNIDSTLPCNAFLYVLLMMLINFVIFSSLVLFFKFVLKSRIENKVKCICPHDYSK